MIPRALVAGLLAATTCASPASAKPAAQSLTPLGLATGWVGKRPVAQNLRGRAVLVDVFTFECINCTRVTPELKRLYATYSRTDLAIVAVHSPEVPSYQSRLEYVSREARLAGLPWPIAVDNEFRIWNAYGAGAWPTQLLFDRSGHLRYTIIGDGQDGAVASAVHRLVNETQR